MKTDGNYSTSDNTARARAAGTQLQLAEKHTAAGDEPWAGHARPSGSGKRRLLAASSQAGAAGTSELKIDNSSSQLPAAVAGQPRPPLNLARARLTATV